MNLWRRGNKEHNGARRGAARNVAVMLLAQSIHQAGSFAIQQVRDRLQHGAYSGAIGAFTFDENREVVQAPELFVVRG